MSPRNHEPEIRRILVALDASPHSLAALEAAAELAALFGAELTGLFVEDVDLLRLADLPLVRRVGRYSIVPRPIERRTMELELRAVAGRARSALAASAGRVRVRWSFEVLRGPVAPAVLERTTGEDLVSLGILGWSPSGKARLGTTARAVLTAARGSTLLLRRGQGLGAPVRVVYEGSASGRHALATAARIAGAHRVPLSVLVAGGGEDERARLGDDARRTLAARRVPATFPPFAAADVASLRVALRGETGGVLVLPAGSSLLPDESLEQILAELEVAVLVIR